MSSREGLTIIYRDLKEKMLEKAMEEVISRNPEMAPAEQKKIAQEVAMGAIKFSILNISNNKTIFFDWDKALSLEGETGPYIQYAAVRAKRILEKVAETKGKPKISGLDKDEEHELVKHLSKFPLIVEESATHYRVHTIANYMHKLAERFNVYYNNIQILNTPEKNLRESRIELVRATFNVMKSCLFLMGINVPERM